MNPIFSLIWQHNWLKMNRVQTPSDEKSELKNKLTNREIEVLQLITEGLLNKEIA